MTQLSSVSCVVSISDRCHRASAPRSSGGASLEVSVAVGTAVTLGRRRRPMVSDSLAEQVKFVEAASDRDQSTFLVARVLRSLTMPS